jgi:hypothetical protein
VVSRSFSSALTRRGTPDPDGDAGPLCAAEVTPGARIAQARVSKLNAVSAAQIRAVARPFSGAPLRSSSCSAAAAA